MCRGAAIPRGMIGCSTSERRPREGLPSMMNLAPLYCVLGPEDTYVWTAVSSPRVTPATAVGACGAGRPQGMVLMSEIVGPPPLQPGPPPSPPAAARKAWYRRPALIIPPPLVVTAPVAAAGVLAPGPTASTATGAGNARLPRRPVTASAPP